jgi:hypothetical protein
MCQWWWHYQVTPLVSTFIQLFIISMIWVQGILAASMLGYVLPSAIYLKSNQAQIRRMLFPTLPASSSSSADEWNDVTALRKDEVGLDAEPTPPGLMGKFIFTATLGTFGVLMLVMGLAMEIYHLTRGEEYIDPTTNY